MLKKLRLNLIKTLIDFNEKIFFERRLRSFYLKIVPIKTVLDVGANKGQSIDFFLKINPNCIIYAFEPNPKLFELLKSKYKTKNNVKLYNLGVSDITGSKIFFENVLDYTSSFEDLNFDSAYLDKKAKILGYKKEEIIKDQYPVSTTTLSDFLSENYQITEIDILKIDTEGHEFNCLIGLFQDHEIPKIRYIQLESHNDDMYINSKNNEPILKLLLQNNYSEKIRIRHGFGDFEEIIYTSDK